MSIPYDDTQEPPAELSSQISICPFRLTYSLHAGPQEHPAFLPQPYTGENFPNLQELAQTLLASTKFSSTSMHNSLFSHLRSLTAVVCNSDRAPKVGLVTGAVWYMTKYP